MKLRVLILIISIIPVRAFSWGQLGHRVIGGIAEVYLTPKAKTEIKKIFGNESVAMASTWADFIKSDRAYDSLSSWHFLNLKPGLNEREVYEILGRNSGVNLYTRLNFLISELKSKNLSKEIQALYLKLLLHFIGDAHQPMHMGRTVDRGGNNIKLFWFNQRTNLHRVWDEHLIEFQQLSYTEYVAAINFPAPAQIRKWQSQPIREWIYESYLIAQGLYEDVKVDEKLMYGYNYKYLGVLNEQLLKGGVRLARVLNEIFD